MTYTCKESNPLSYIAEAANKYTFPKTRAIGSGIIMSL